MDGSGTEWQFLTPVKDSGAKTSLEDGSLNLNWLNILWRQQALLINFDKLKENNHNAMFAIAIS